MINLFSGYFESKDEKRREEIDFCLHMNKNNPHIDRIHIFQNRPTYQDFFTATIAYPNDINIFANADIYFNDTLQLVSKIKEHECYALTRWELVDGNVISFMDRNQHTQAQPRHSQDVWIFRGAVKDVFGGFFIGQPGCDNRIAYEIDIAGYKVTNPSLSIQAVHVHKSDSRLYNTEPVPRPYKWIEQTRL